MYKKRHYCCGMGRVSNCSQLTAGNSSALGPGQGLLQLFEPEVYKAFGEEMINAFSMRPGNKVDAYRASSEASCNRLMNDYADIATTARKPRLPSADYGYYQVAFCKDPLAIIIKQGCGVTNISQDQLKSIFTGEIRNWKEVGGPTCQ